MDNPNGEEDRNRDSLREFVEEECLEQMRTDQDASRSEETSIVDSERINNFFERALSESKRMSKEVFKCHTQLNDLHAELGADKFASWTADHASEVLSSEEFYLWAEQEK